MGEKAEVTSSHRVVLDTNVALSALLFRQGQLAWLRQACDAGTIVPVISAQTIAELVRVLAYPKFKLSEDEAKSVLAHYVKGAEVVQKVSAQARVPVCRDPDDRILLQLAYSARVETLVTGDADLLALADASSVPILSPAQLKAKLRY